MNKIYTIGHSTVDINVFLQKLHEYKITTLIDVRTTPYSRRAKKFNRETLDKILKDHGIEYLYRGKNLGGLEENIYYAETIQELILLSQHKTLVLMCSEGDYRRCHRYTTLTPSFEKNNVLVEHIAFKQSSKGIN